MFTVMVTYVRLRFQSHQWPEKLLFQSLKTIIHLCKNFWGLVMFNRNIIT